jgi:hypothetical protein
MYTVSAPTKNDPTLWSVTGAISLRRNSSNVLATSAERRLGKADVRPVCPDQRVKLWMKIDLTSGPIPKTKPDLMAADVPGFDDVIVHGATLASASTRRYKGAWHDWRPLSCRSFWRSPYRAVMAIPLGQTGALSRRAGGQMAARACL